MNPKYKVTKKAVSQLDNGDREAVGKFYHNTIRERFEPFLVFQSEQYHDLHACAESKS